MSNKIEVKEELQRQINRINQFFQDEATFGFFMEANDEDNEISSLKEMHDYINLGHIVGEHLNKMLELVVIWRNNL